VKNAPFKKVKINVEDLRFDKNSRQVLVLNPTNLEEFSNGCKLLFVFY